MPHEFLHQHKDFADLIRIVGDDQSIDPVLVEKDYWIMHCLYGLKQLGLAFQLKGGTSLSKGLCLINRFSEDIDVRIEPPKEMGVATNPNQQKATQVQSRKDFYDSLAKTIKIDGIVDVERDSEFDDLTYYRSGGIRLRYESHMGSMSGVRDGILLEVGFDDVSPNSPHTISSWAYDHSVGKVDVFDNKAVDVACYHPGYTFVEKLQTLSTKYRRQQENGNSPDDFMRHYYDVFCLLKVPEVREFIGTDEYKAHKKKRFRKADNLVLAENEAFLLSNPEIRKVYAQAYNQSQALFYKPPPDFVKILEALSDAVRIEGI